ncbi:MAG TPA: class I SAM-dependent methyltransferase [Nitrospiria bacterium]|nr:class I SAM-dependent methyltransferase [Nitrospiria bacterium]
MDSHRGSLETAVGALRDRVETRGNWFQRLQFAYKTDIFQESACLSYFTPDGTALDLGCGTGIGTCLIALAFPEKQVIGIDLDERRIKACARIAEGIPNVAFHAGDLRRFAPAASREAICFDVLHHLPEGDQDRLVMNVAARLERGGRFLLFEVDKNPARKWKYWMSVIVDYLLYPFQEKAHFRTADAYRDLFGRAGLEVERVQPLSSPLVAPILYVGRRAGKGEG